MNALATWILALMTAISPPARDAARAASKLRATETGEQRAQRYTGIAYDIAQVVEGHALPGLSEQQTAALLVSVTFYESSYSLDVDDGTCNDKFVELAASPLPSGKKPLVRDPRCDSGKSVGLMQLHVEGRSFMGKTMEDLRGISNRQAMLETGLRALRMGVTACTREWKHENPGWKVQPGLARPESKVTAGDMVHRGLAWYARGACRSSSGLKDGDKKLKLVHRFFTERTFPKLGAITPVEATQPD